MASVGFQGATRVFPDSDRPAVDSLSLEVDDGEFLVLVGPSGCGKSTSLRMVAGLETVDDGAIVIGDREVTHVAPKDRDVAMVFQNYALYPHMTVADNMSFALKMARVSKEEIATRVLEAARILDLVEYLERKPRALSGGQRQRVAMGRAIVRNPQVFLMDEPLSNLDAQLRVQTRTQIAALQERLGVTTIYVTHDQVEAMTMGDRVAVMREGVLQQVAVPRTLFARPANVFVAGFIGSPQMNVRESPVVDGHVEIGGFRLPLPRSVVAALAGEQRLLVGFRPESLAPADEGIPLTVEIVEELGSDAYLYGRLNGNGNGDVRSDVVARIDPRAIPRRGETITMRVDPDDLHLFSTATGERVG
jgi:multiple sugar transport system ATP-binding protein